MRRLLAATILAAVVFALVACAPAEEPDFHADETFTEAERYDIARANNFAAWYANAPPYRIAFDAPHRAAPARGEIGRVADGKGYDADTGALALPPGDAPAAARAFAAARRASGIAPKTPESER